MTATVVALIIAAIAGAAMAVQGSLNSVLGKTVGQIEATLVVHIIGTLVVVLLVLFKLGNGDLSKLNQAPWYVYLGGVINVLIIYGVVASIPRVGVALATTAIIVGQVSTALVIDHFGLFGLEKVCFTWYKCAGLILLAVGARLMLN
ncbi:MAG: DMT family transporter [Thermoanaerobacteraceae bacterium]|nr:DMT family transporter [Thermoanaerobacteraceae bacterium]